jgi:hypothetical protein
VSLRRKPHTATHTVVSESHTGGRVDVPVEGATRTISGQLTPMTADSVFRTFAGDLTVGRPHMWLCDDDAYNRTIKAGDKFTISGVKYYVNAAPMHWGAGTSTNCIQILLEMEQHQ